MGYLVRDAWIERLLTSDEPAARFVALTGLVGEAGDAAAVLSARAAVLADARTRALLDRIVPWEVENPISGHQAPTFAPNLINFLLDVGVRRGDDERLDDCVAAMLAQQSDDGRFTSLMNYRGTTAWASLPCDHHPILEVLIRTGHADDPRTQRGLERLLDSLTRTPQGPGWQCVPDPVVGFRGPGRKDDVCPQATLQALRASSWLAPRPDVSETVRTLLGVWRTRAAERPYMFGHGRSFKEGKWPPSWYSALAVVDAVGRYPSAWEAPDDRRALAELGACVLDYQVDADGRVAPHSVFTGFAEQTFGKRGRASDTAAALVLRALARLEPIAADVLAVDVTTLASAKGGTGVALPPRG